ncbi:hypothetical protein LINPERHAP2_LOCUS7218 [Linum perenne]
MESDTAILILIPNMILGDHISSNLNQHPQEYNMHKLNITPHPTQHYAIEKPLAQT